VKKKKKDDQTQRVIYTGRRLMNSGKVWHRFEGAGGVERFFSGVCGVYIGHTYKCTPNSIQRRPERDQDVESVDNPAWEAADELVDAELAKRRAEKKVASRSKPAIKAALAALEPLCRNLDFFEMEKLIKYLAVEARNKWN